MIRLFGLFPVSEMTLLVGFFIGMLVLFFVMFMCLVYLPMKDTERRWKREDRFWEKCRRMEKSNSTIG